MTVGFTSLLFQSKTLLPDAIPGTPSMSLGFTSMLFQSQIHDAMRGYGGVRIDQQGQLFMIRNARIWTLWDEEGRRCGQAAAFSSWWWL